MLEPVAEGLDLGPLPVELLLEMVDASLGRVNGDGLDDVVSLAVEDLARLVAVDGHRGDIALSSAEDGKSAGNALGNRSRGESIRRGPRKSLPDDCTCSDGYSPGKPYGEG